VFNVLDPEILTETLSSKQKLVSVTTRDALFDAVIKLIVSDALQPNAVVTSNQYDPSVEAEIEFVVDASFHKYVAPEFWYELLLSIDNVGLVTQLTKAFEKFL
tara:strand:- start:1 stop:309 length:309 start_codon:yes stop_codon:yes gene_type:complete